LPFELGRVTGGVLLLLAALAGLAGCARSRDPYLQPLLQMESPAADQEGSDRRIRELEQGIRRYRGEVERTVKGTAQLEVYYKMLGAAYMQRGMYQPAYEALQQALAIQSENPILFYYAALCSASLSKAQGQAAERTGWLERSQWHYLRALELDPGYVDALYGLAVLYVFELQRPQEAVVLLERLLRRETRNTPAQLLLGNAYYRAGRLEDALVVFRDVAAHANLPALEAQRREAQENAERIEEELHGAP